MATKKLVPGYLEKFISPGTWYRYRELITIIPLSESTITRFLRKVPHITQYEPVPGCIFEHPRPVRYYPGAALIDVANND